MTYWDRFTNRRLSRRRSLAGIGSIGMGAILLAACGGDDDDAGSSTGTTTGATGAQVTSSAGGPASTPGGVPANTPGAGGQGSSSLLSLAKDESAQALRGGVFRHYLIGDIPAFEPQLLGGNAQTTYRAYSGILKEVEGVLGAPEGEMEGDIAASWEMAPDNLSIVFKLNERAAWPPLSPVDSRPVDAEDIVVTIERHASVSNRRGEFHNSVAPNAPIISATAIDARTVRVDLAFPYAPALSLFGMNFLGGLFVVPKESAGDHDPSRSVVGTGPWYLDEYQPSIKAVFKANPGYQHEGLPYMEAMELPIVSEYATGLAQFRAGNIYHFAINAEDLLPMKRDIPNIQITPTPTMQSLLWHVIFGKQGPFVDERLRQAYVMTWDREAILDTFYNVSTFEAAGFPVDSAYESGIQANHWEGWFLNAKDEAEFGPNAKYFKLDLEEAKRLLDAAGFPDGVSMKIHHPQPGINPLWEQINQVVAGFANDSGLFRGEFEAHERVPDFIPNFQGGKGEFDGIAHYYANQPQDPTVYLYSFYHPSGGQVGITDGTMEDLINRSLREFDPEKRKELTWEIQRYEGEKQFFPRMVGAKGFSTYWPVVRNVNVFASTSENYSRWFIDPSKPPLA